jgi:hypothetical protein
MMACVRGSPSRRTGEVGSRHAGMGAQWKEFSLFQLFSNDSISFKRFKLAITKTRFSFCPKFSKLGMLIDKFKLHNFSYCPNLQISLDFEL